MRIKDICSSVTDGSHNPPQGINNSQYMMLSSKNIFDDKITFEEPRFLSEEDFERENRRTKISEGDVLITIVGTVGRTAVVDSNMPAFTLQRSVAVLHPKKDICSGRFLMYALRGKRSYIENRAKGVAQKGIYLGEVSDIDIHIPDITEQALMIDKLDKVCNVIRLRQQELAELDNLIKARFVELFGDAIHNDKGWETDTVEKLCKEIYGGGTPSKLHPEYYEDGDIPWVSSKDMKTDVLTDSQIKINQLGVDNSTARMVPINSVIMVIRSGILKHTLPVAINAVPITVNQDLKVFIPNERVLTRFLAVQFKMHEKDILSRVRAVTADNIEFNSLKQRELIVPPIELQQEYVSFLEQIDKSKVVVQKALDEAQLLFDSLMQEYFG